MQFQASESTSLILGSSSIAEKNLSPYKTFSPHENRNQGCGKTYLTMKVSNCSYVPIFLFGQSMF